MTRFILPALCAMGLLAGTAVAQQPRYYARTSSRVVDMGSYRMVAGSPYYTPGSSVPGYYSPGYSGAYHRTLTFPAYGPMATYQPQVYTITGYGGYLRPIR